MTAVLAADLVAALQGNARGALAAEVDDRGTVDGHGVEPAALVAKGVLGAHRGDLVGFTRHFGGWMNMQFARGRRCVRRGDTGLEREVNW